MNEKTSSEKSIDSYDTLSKIVSQLEKCNYESIGGSLVMNTAFIALKRMAEKEPVSVKKLQDFESDFYWIPEDRIEKFNEDSEMLGGMQYMDNPELFEKFNDDFGIFATGGCADLVPDVFDNKNVKFI